MMRVRMDIMGHHLMDTSTIMLMGGTMMRIGRGMVQMVKRRTLRYAKSCRGRVWMKLSPGRLTSGEVSSEQRSPQRAS